jgi:hypothetical protein
VKSIDCVFAGCSVLYIERMVHKQKGDTMTKQRTNLISKCTIFTSLLLSLSACGSGEENKMSAKMEVSLDQEGPPNAAAIGARQVPARSRGSEG